MKFDVFNRFSGKLQFTAEIDCFDNAPTSLKLGLSVKWAYKTRANLDRASLDGASLDGARLNGASLVRASLDRASLDGVKEAPLIIARTRILPAGALIGWKKLKGGTLAKLSIPAEARRSHAFGRKCRAEFVDVLEGEGVSTHAGKTKYAPGLRVTCHEWDEDWTTECSGGIHFFVTKEEAEAWDV